MHISNGILTGVPAVATTAVSLGLVALGLHHAKRFAARFPHWKPLLGMAGAFVFFLSFIPIPIGMTCSHPCGTPLAGMLLGPWIGIALAGLSLVMQLLYMHGGIDSWGANVLALGVGGALGGWAVFRLALKLRAPLWLAGGLGGFFGNLFTYGISGGILGAVLTTGPDAHYSLGQMLTTIYAAYLPVQGPLAIGEALLSGYLLHFVFAQRPEILLALRVIPEKSPTATRIPAPTVLLLMVLGLSLLTLPGRVVGQEPTTPVAQVEAAPMGTGMDEAVNERLAEEHGKPAKPLPWDFESMGDVWNMLLLLAGGVSGFVIGRWSHLLTASKKAPETAEE